MFKEEKRYFALRKLTVGLASVLIGISFIGKGHVVKAETIEPQKQETAIENEFADDSQSANAQVVKTANASQSSQSVSQNDVKPDVAIAHDDIKTDAQKSGTNSSVKNDVISNTAKAGADKVIQTPVKQDALKTDNVTGADTQNKTIKDGITTLNTMRKTPISANELKENKIAVQSANGLPILNTNDQFALDPKNGLHEHANVNDNGGYDEDFWGKIDVSKFDTILDGDMLEITDYIGISGEDKSIILPNINDFWAVGRDHGAKGVEISKTVMEHLINGYGKVAISKSNNNKLVAIGSDWSDLHSYFGTDILDIADLHNFDTHNITNMSNMFTHIQKAPVIGDISDWDTSHVTDMHGMFSEDYNLTGLGDLGKWDVSHVVNASKLFGGELNITSLGDLSDWNTGNMVNMSQMFADMDSLKSLGHLDKWNVAKVTDMSFLFSRDKLITDLGDLSGWNTSNVTNMYGTFQDMSDLKQLNISNWNLTKLTNSDKLSAFLTFDSYSDPTQTESHLLVFANNIKLPDWYATGPASNQYFADHMVVLTNNSILLNQSGASDDLEVHYADQGYPDPDSRSIFYDSRGTVDAIGVISKYNDDFTKQYPQKHPGYAIVLAPTVDQTDPISLANASFNTVDSTITIKFVDDVDTDKTVPNAITASGQGSYPNLPDIPLNYEIDEYPPAELYYGNTYTFKVKHHMDTTPQYDYASRQFDLHYPDGHTDIIIQRIGLQRNVTTDTVTKKSTHTAWIVYDPDSSFTIDGARQAQLAYEVKDGKIKFTAINLPSVPGYKPVIRQGIKNDVRTMMISFIALPTPADKPRVPSTPAVINKPDNIVVNNKQKNWHIDQKADNKVSYTVTNDQVAIKLPKLPDQVLNIIKTSDYILAFSYLKLNRPNSLIFSVKQSKRGYVLTILDDGGQTVKIINCKTYKELTKKIIELNK